MSNREPFWWPMNEPPLPYGDLTPIQAQYFEELGKEVPEDDAFRDIIDRTKHETRIRNGREDNGWRIVTGPIVSYIMGFEPSRDLQVDPEVTTKAANHGRVMQIARRIIREDAELLERLADE